MLPMFIYMLRNKNTGMIYIALSNKQMIAQKSRAVVNRSKSGLFGEASGNNKLSWEEVDEIRVLYKAHVRQVDIADKFNITQSTVSAIVRNATWVRS
jgi:DNA-binding MarR family transcriptional regulator